MKWPWGSK